MWQNDKRQGIDPDTWNEDVAEQCGYILARLASRGPNSNLPGKYKSSVGEGQHRRYRQPCRGHHHVRCGELPTSGRSGSRWGRHTNCGVRSLVKRCSASEPWCSGCSRDY